MQDLEKLQEIEELGLEEEGDTLFQEPEGGNSSGVPLVQAALCLVALVALLVLRYSDSPIYSTFEEWYHKEASQEIQLPEWEGAAPSPSPAPSPSVSPEPSPSPAAWETDASLQRV